MEWRQGALPWDREQGALEALLSAAWVPGVACRKVLLEAEASRGRLFRKAGTRTESVPKTLKASVRGVLRGKVARCKINHPP